MLFYIRCPSCSRIISYSLDKYHEDLGQILNDNTLSSQERDQKRANLLDKYNIRNICCRIRIMGLIPYHEIILT